MGYLSAYTYKTNLDQLTMRLYLGNYQKQIHIYHKWQIKNELQ